MGEAPKRERAEGPNAKHPAHDVTPQRRHPHRLPHAEYRSAHKIVFITMSVRPPESLMAHRMPGDLVGAMGRIGASQRVRIIAYCIMPDHVHVVASPAEGGDVAAWVRYVKREVAKRRRTPGMWQRSYWDRHARPGDDMEATVLYVLENPVQRGLCEAWQDWPCSWSEWHDGGRGDNPNLSWE